MSRRGLLIVGLLGLVIIGGILLLLAGHHKTQQSVSDNSNPTSTSSSTSKKSTSPSKGSTSTKGTGADSSSSQSSGSSSSSATPSGTTVSQTIADQTADPSLKGAGFSVDSVRRAADNWYIARVTPTGSDQQSVLLRKDSNGNFTLIAGPSGQFSESQLDYYLVPQSVINQLPVLN